MPRVSIRSIEEAPLLPTVDGSSGSIEVRALFDRPVDPIHLRLYRLGPGAQLTYHAETTDRLVYVWDGAITARGSVMRERSSSIVEWRASLTVTALNAGAALLVFEMRDRAKTSRSGGHVHILPSERVPRVEDADGSHVGMALHADAQCPTCQLWLHENDYVEGDRITAIHSHSEDEIIFVRAGSIRLGKRLHGPGTALAITANTKYGFSSGPYGLSFVNFRGQSPTYRSADGSVVLDEAELWRTTVGRPEYL